MQGYKDAPNFPSPVPIVGPGRSGHEQARLNEMIRNQVITHTFNPE